MPNESAVRDSSPGSDVTTRCRAGGMFVPVCEIAGRSSLRMAVIVSADVDRWKARLPVSIS